MISIFAKPPFLRAHPNVPIDPDKPHKQGHMMRVSSIIRGIQISKQLGCKLNPTEGYENDVCIYVKPHVPVGYDFKFEGRPYMDIIDGWGLYPLMIRHPEVPVIVISKMDQEILSRIIPNKIIFIPQHHINFERVPRIRDVMTNVGVVGSSGAFPFLPGELKTRLEERGMKLLEFSKFDERTDVVKFYQSIDLQLVWRPYRKRLGNPLKLVNGASLGVPTIALQEVYFDREFEGLYFPVQTLDGFFSMVDTLRANPKLYEDYSKRLVEKSEEYHIEKVADMYRQLT
jgi:hypothetical protein